MAVMTKAQRDERDRVIAQAVADGKITAGRVHVYREMWDKNPGRTRATLAQLAPVLASAREPAVDPVRAQVARGLEAAGVLARDAEREPAVVSTAEAQIRAGLRAAGVEPRKEA